MTDYATYLTARLAALGLSRNALARALGHKGASQVSRWCAGKAVPREKARAKIEAALDIWVRYLKREAEIEADYRAFFAVMDPVWVDPTKPPHADPHHYLIGTDSHEDAPGTTIPGGEASEGATFTVERGVVEGG